jgi:hypothetical protein
MTRRLSELRESIRTLHQYGYKHDGPGTYVKTWTFGDCRIDRRLTIDEVVEFRDRRSWMFEMIEENVDERMKKEITRRANTCDSTETK